MRGEHGGGSRGAGILVPVGRHVCKLRNVGRKERTFETLRVEAVVVGADVDDVDIGIGESGVLDSTAGGFHHERLSISFEPTEAGVGPSDDGGRIRHAGSFP